VNHKEGSQGTVLRDTDISLIAVQKQIDRINNEAMVLALQSLDREIMAILKKEERWLEDEEIEYFDVTFLGPDPDDWIIS